MTQDSDEARVRAMQFEQVPLDGGRPKARVGLATAWILSTLALVLPVRLRTALGFALNFLLNDVRATLVLVLAWISRALLGVGMLAVYWLVVGPSALALRLIGRDDLRLRKVDGSMWTDKAPPDTDPSRFQRQY